MPFEKGVATPGAGRRGYEIEQEQLETMRRVLAKDLKWMENMQEKRQNGEKIDGNTLDFMKVVATRINKIMDKLHASKQDITSDGKAINISIAKEIAEQNDLLDKEIESK